MKDKKQIAIIGGGIAGLTFVRCLNNDEYDIHIFEKKDFFGEVGAAISIFPNALCVLDELGLLDKVLKCSGKIKKVFFKNHKGKILSTSEPFYDYPVICMHRATLHKILFENIQAKLYTDYELKAITNKEDSRVELVFANGEMKSFDAVIAADGLHSAVRKYILDDGLPIYRGYNIWRGIAKTNFDNGYGSETYGLGQRVGIVPIKEGEYGWWATCNEDYLQSDSPEPSKDKLERLFKGWHYPIGDLIKNTDSILKTGIYDRIPKKGWAKGNIVLLGDAAHPTTPNLGQGGCMAIEGAYILAKSINKYGFCKKAYDRYEELQFPRSEMIVKESLKMGKMGQLSDPVLAWLRNVAMKILPARVAIKMVDKFFGYRVTKIEV